MATEQPGDGFDAGPFADPATPSRRYARDGLEYVGGSVFRLVPDREYEAEALREVVLAVLESGPYRWGDFLDVPMPLWLVRDDETSDVFRVAVRDGSVALHTVPTTEPAGLASFYRRLRRRETCDWTVERREKA